MNFICKSSKIHLFKFKVQLMICHLLTNCLLESGLLGATQINKSINQSFITDQYNHNQCFMSSVVIFHSF